MLDVEIRISGYELDQAEAQKMAEQIAIHDNPEAICVARYNRLANACSPCCLKSSLGDKPGWEVYGENHGGRLKITFNEGDYVFIFS